MATVFLAHDLRNKRQVALKVLRPELAALLGAERFLAEIETTANLQHPHILPLFDSGEAGSFLYYVMPYIEGESLRDRLDRERQLPVPDAVRIATEVAGALDYAHRHGILHRDIKPENILLQDGQALVADFGIALAIGKAGGARLTETGMSVGTPQYMSPEQAAAGRQLDGRSDIYSLGAVLYEMLAGEPPFTGATGQAVIARLMTTQPTPLQTLRHTVPEEVEEAVARALAKVPADRFASAAEFAAALASAAGPPRAAAAATPGGSRARRSPARRTALRSAQLLTLVAILGYLGWRFTRSAPALSLGAVRQVTFEDGLEIEPSLSPDGKYVAYVAGSPSRIYLRQPGSRPVQLIAPDTGGPQRRPRWSPDGTRILFDSQLRLFVIPALGGVPRLVAAAGWSPTWAPDGRRVAFAMGDTIYTTDVEGGTPTRLAVVKEPAELAWSPDGRWIALTSGNDGWDGAGVSVGQIGNIAQTRILLIDARQGGITALTDRTAMNVSPVWGPTSRRILFVSTRGGGRDVYSAEINDAGRPTAPPVRLSTGLDAHTIGLSSTGNRLTYSAYQARVNIYSLPIPKSGPVGLAGAVPLTRGTQTIEAIVVSRDARWLYFTSDRTGNSDIYRFPLPGGEPEQLTTDPADDFGPDPSPDGASLVFYSLRGGTRDLWMMPIGPGKAVRLTDDPGEEYWPHWSPDGQSVCYGQLNAESGNGTRLIRRNRAGWSQPVLLEGTGIGEDKSVRGELPGCLGWMPDGKWIIVSRGEEIALVPVDGGAPRIVYHGDPRRGLPSPRTVLASPDGRSLYFRSDEGLWSIPAEGGTPRRLVRLDDSVRHSTRAEWATDGKRFYFSLGDPQSDVFVAELTGLK